MSNFVWNISIGISRLAYSGTDGERKSIQEYDGWWRHLGCGLFVFIKKRKAGWVSQP